MATLDALEEHLDALRDEQGRILGRLIGLSEVKITRIDQDTKVARWRRHFTEEEREQIVALRIQRAKKHDEICACVAGALGYGTDPATLSEELVSRVAEEADELINNWADDVEESSDPGLWEKASRPEPGIQQLLAEHYALSDRIMAIQDEVWERARGCDDDEDNDEI